MRNGSTNGACRRHSSALPSFNCRLGFLEIGPPSKHGFLSIVVRTSENSITVPDSVG
jgi:hypothetical protein